MSLESDKVIVMHFLETARQRVEQAIASYNNGDYDKAKLRILQHNAAFNDASVAIGIVKEKTDLVASAEASKSEEVVVDQIK